MIAFRIASRKRSASALLAFTAAKKALRVKYPDPFYWAPFL